MRERLRRHRIACYVTITFAVTWTAWLVLAVGGTVVSAGFSPLYLLGLLGPLIGAVVTTAIVDGRAGLRDLVSRTTRLRVGLRWWAVAIGLPLAIAAATYVVLVAYSVFLLAPVELPTPRGFGQFVGFPVTNAIVLAILLIAINGLGEESGWRGFLLPALQRRWSPLTASLIVAGVWALWHVPAFVVNENYRAMPAAMLPMFFVGLACGSVFLTWLYNRGRRSIALVATWHGLFNFTTGTVAARGGLAAVETSVVLAIAGVLLVRELRAIRRERHGLDARHVMSAEAA
jgi:membrane protease YdiL (CAAX protease family)